MTPIRAAILTILPFLTLSGCASVSAPWTCTPETCAAVATLDIPDEPIGGWVSPDDDRLLIARFLDPNMERITTSAFVRLNRQTGNLIRAGDVLIIELRLEPKKDAPRRYALISVIDNTLQWRDLLPSTIETNDETFRIITHNDTQGIVYEDLQAMLDTLELAAHNDSHWSNPTTYTRAN